MDDVLVRQRTAFQELLIGHCESYGLCLFLDDLVQSTEADEAVYHEFFVHPAMVLHGNIRKVLIGGTGEGATLRELVRYASIESIVSVDLDKEVVEACREHMPTWSAGAFADPRVQLRFEDIMHTLASAPANSYDAILLDVTDPVEDGPSVELFTVRFFAKVAAALADDGIVVLQSGELDPIDLAPTRAVLATLGEVFAWVHMMHISVPSFHGTWTLTLAGKQPLDSLPADLDARIAKLAAFELQHYSAASHRAAMEMPRQWASGLAEPGRVVTGEDAERIVSYPKRL